MSRKLTCGVCGSPFTCELSMSCWCGGRKLSNDAIERISRFAGDCICPSCIASFETERTV
ncbi:MAG: hypothetical protein FJ358_07080 [Thaumarchaeota archaeon]|nr:hypothetical protein [Nitrososphaerota archaeon]